MKGARNEGNQLSSFKTKSSWVNRYATMLLTELCLSIDSVGCVVYDRALYSTEGAGQQSAREMRPI
jgi:hypothetical protein